jgi:DNA transposition AAA+ family ATPase
MSNLNNEIIIDYKNMNNEELGKELQKLKDEHGLTYTQVAEKIGYSRANISNFANQFTATDKVKSAVADFLNNFYSNIMTDEDIENLTKYKREIEIYPTEELIKALGFLEDIKRRKKMGCMIGAPGCGKTTAIDEYCKRNSNVVVIEACSGMRENDLLDEIADGLGISLKNGSPHKKITQIIREYSGQETMIIIDEAEYLKKWDIDKFETLRKIWDKTRIPMIFVGTEKLKRHLITGGNGKDNLAQLYRRLIKFEFEGVKRKEIFEMLNDFNIDKKSTEILVEVATDYTFGGLGNFIEILELCLEETQGDKITIEITENAKSYKMLFKQR